ncbi:hypothetical protein [Lysinibacillus sp. NPDC093692]|uniref:hypothetical protein n=1 Tax=Lysinibacillus sp. NPDC093692 TaxID=3390578 RepID=UPI003D01FC78
MLIEKVLFNNFFKKDNKDNFINLDINTFELFGELLAAGKLKGNRHMKFAFSCKSNREADGLYKQEKGVIRFYWFNIYYS